MLYIYKNTSPTVKEKSFSSLFSANDQIEINSTRYRIQNVNSATQITLINTFTGVTASGLSYRRNNALSNNRPSVYYGSKRIFIPMELEYLE